MKEWDKNRVFTIAEIGGNHEGNFDKAIQLLNLAKETGFDAIKFQIYTSKNLVNSNLDQDRANHFKNFELKKEEYVKLAELTKNSGLQFMSSIWDINALDYFDKYIDVHKIGSGDLTSYPLIKKIVLKNKPTILSTGLSTIDDIFNTIKFIEKVDNKFVEEGKLALMQCTSMYPIPDEDASLNSIKYLADVTKLPVGYSDHTVGSYAIEIAVAMGASIIEKHFTNNKDNKSFRDHKVSLTQKEMINFIRKVKKIKILQGSYEKKIMNSEKINLKSFRRAAYFNKNLYKGDVIREKDLEVLRPFEGIGAQYYYDLIGKRLNRDIKSYEKLNWDYFD